MTDSRHIPREDDESRFRRVRKGFWKTVKRAGRKVPFVKDAVASYYCMLDEKVPMKVRASVAVPLAYFVMPLDAIPDFIAAAGFVDDNTFFAGAFILFRGHVSETHYASAKEALSD